MKVLNFFRILIALFITVIITNSCINKPDILPAKQYSVEDFFRNPENLDYDVNQLNLSKKPIEKTRQFLCLHCLNDYEKQDAT